MTWGQVKERAISLAHTPRLLLAQKAVRQNARRPHAA